MEETARKEPEIRNSILSSKIPIRPRAKFLLLIGMKNIKRFVYESIRRFVYV